MIINRDDLKRLAIEEYGSDIIENQNKILIILSVALTSRISYTTIGEDSEFTFKKAKEMYEKLKNLGHWSCFSHIARCMADYQYESWVKGQANLIVHFDGSDHYEIPDDIKGYNKQFRGFLSLRQFIEDGTEIK